MWGVNGDGAEESYEKGQGGIVGDLGKDMETCIWGVM